jgi:hypothetical protein
MASPTAKNASLHFMGCLFRCFEFLQFGNKSKIPITEKSVLIKALPNAKDQRPHSCLTMNRAPIS